MEKEKEKNFVRNVRFIMLERGMTKADLAKASNSGVSSVYAWLSGKRPVTEYTVHKVSEALKLPASVLLSSSISSSTLAACEQKPVLVDDLLVLASVPAGVPDLNFSDGRPFSEVMGVDEDSFVLRVTGDSMTGRYVEQCIPNGAFVLMTRRGLDVASCVGHVVYASVDNGEYSLKELRITDEGYFLVPWNSRYRPIPVGENTRILGKLLGWFVKA